MNERLKKLIYALGKKQTVLSRELGISEGGFRGLLTGRVKTMSADMLVALQEKYNVNPFWLIRGEGSMFLSEEKPQPTQLPVCRTTDECLDSITHENVHQTRWFKELDKDRQFLVAAANTPEIPDKDIARVAGYLQAAKDRADDDAALQRYKKGAAG